MVFILFITYTIIRLIACDHQKANMFGEIVVSFLKAKYEASWDMQ
jgi:hypothetical protein